MPWLVGPLNWDINVVRLLLGELGQLGPKLVEVQDGHFLIKLLWKHFDANLA